MQTWKHRPSNEVISDLAEMTMGFSGSDLQAFCTETVLCCLKRLYPSVKNNIGNHKVKIDVDKFKACL